VIEKLMEGIGGRQAGDQAPVSTGWYIPQGFLGSSSPGKPDKMPCQYAALRFLISPSFTADAKD